MVFDWANVGTPFFWFFLAALFAGAAGAGIFRGQRSQRGQQRLALVYLYLSVSVGAASAGILVPGLERFLDLRLAYFSVAIAVVSYLAFRYKIAIGAPVLLIVIVLVTLLGVGLRSWLPVKGNRAELAEVQVLGGDGNRIDLETTLLGTQQAGSTVTGTLPAGAVAPVVEVLTLSPYYFFFPSPLLCRFDGLTGGAGGGRRASLSLPGAESAGEAIVARFPGIRHRTIVGEAVNPIMLQKYRVQLSSGLVAALVAGSP